jgi:hypothetical protein
MTLILSGLPLAMIGTVGYWLHRRTSADQTESPTPSHEADEDPA